ncbi:MAG: N-acetyl-gamma-glutamyl-phosphate reductase [Calothrix sp. SM1_5_4]|nr:N-acetyl-gamma-glutamyl-phosphate reductase [Calothrix sp. SM1_5_4]
MAHPRVTLTHCFATREFSLADELMDARAADVVCMTDEHIDEHIMDNLGDIVFLATPAETSLRLAPRILHEGKTVIDLSGAFRLREHDYETWYGFRHTEFELLREADYGVVPYCGPARPETRLIANPGCFATAVTLALIPLLKHGLVEPRGLVIDAKSGTTGGGRKASENLLFSEVSEDCLPYRVGRHQHWPEIREATLRHTGQEPDAHFATHLLPVRRGIIAGIYAKTKATGLDEIAAAYEAEYGAYPLVRHGRDVSRLAKLTSVTRTPYTHISYALSDGKLYVFSVIDNLMKGAASQAIENLNRVLDLPPAFALTPSQTMEV